MYKEVAFFTPRNREGYNVATEIGRSLEEIASTVTLVDETAAKKGDIVIGQNGMTKTFIGAITAVDNTKRQISFKHPKELFADTVLNPFKYTETIG